MLLVRKPAKPPIRPPAAAPISCGQGMSMLRSRCVGGARRRLVDGVEQRAGGGHGGAAGDPESRGLVVASRLQLPRQLFVGDIMESGIGGADGAVGIAGIATISAIASVAVEMVGCPSQQADDSAFQFRRDDILRRGVVISGT